MSAISKTMKSVLLTKGITFKHDARQAIAASYVIPSEAVRILVGNLVLEEVLETLDALGLVLQWNELLDDPKKRKFDIKAVPNTDVPGHHLDILKIIDGVCDTKYTADGVLAACGVPDKPHMREVCKANDSKFPGGVVTLNPDTGKYLKPPGWKAPDHEKVMRKQRLKMDMIAKQSKIVRKHKKGKK